MMRGASPANAWIAVRHDLDIQPKNRFVKPSKQDKYMIFTPSVVGLFWPTINRFLLIMKLAIFLIFAFSICAFAEGKAQQVTLNAENATLRNVMKEIQKQQGYSFFFLGEKIATTRITAEVKQADLAHAMEHILNGQDLDWSLDDGIITIMAKASRKIIPSVLAQERVVRGKVTDEQGNPIAGVTVKVKGTSVVTTTEEDGSYRITVASDGNFLTFTNVGFETTERQITIQNHIDVSLKVSVSDLEEVVVVGYGTQKKSNITGSVSTINFEKESASRPLTNLSSALAGLSPGLQIMQNSGQPSSDGATMRIRGVGTLNSISPLVLVDGFEQSISDINPSDVASITVLKDAASAAIYGNRGANGVILITTKEGQQGKTKLNYKGLFSFNQPSNLIDLVTSNAEYMEYMNESSTNVGQSKIFTDETIAKWREADKDPNGISASGYPNYVAYPNTDWYKAVFQNKIMQEHTITASGATEKTTFNFSGSRLDNPGLIDGTAMKKHYLRSNVSTEVFDWLRIGNRTWGYQSDVERNSTVDALSDLGFRKIVPGIYPYYDGKYGAPEAPQEDPQSHNALWDIQSTGGGYTYSQINTTFFANLNFLKDFRYDVNFNYARFWSEQAYNNKSLGKYSFSQGDYIIAASPPSELRSMVYNEGSKNWKFSNTLSWNKTLDNRHDLGLMAGFEEISFSSYNVDAQKAGLIDESITDLSTATSMLAISGTNTAYTARSFFGRITYAYDSKYMFESSFRNDGSSRFSPGMRWGFFPSFSAGWRISRESFMKDLPFNELKLRASWGKLGNNSIGNYDWQSTYAAANYSFAGKLSSGLGQTSLANRNLVWESSTISNVGLDYATLNNRLSGSVDYYHKETNGILFRPNIYATMGNVTAPYENLAEVTNKGVEVNVQWRDKMGELTYNIAANFSYNRNRVTKYKGNLERGWVTDENGNAIYQSNLGDVSTGGTNRIVEGKAVNEFYTLTTYQGSQQYYHSDGMVDINGGPRDGMIRTEADMDWLQAMINAGNKFYPNQSIGKSGIWYGDYLYADLNNDGIYGNTYDFEFQNASPVPSYDMGLQLSFVWKNWDLSMNWTASLGYNIYWYTAGQNSSATIYGYAVPNGIANDHYFYDPDNPTDPRTNLVSKNPRLTRNSGSDQSGQVSTLHLENGNFLRLKNFTFGYNIPASVSSKVYCQNIRLFASGENLLTITNFKGMDPEMGTGVGYVLMKQLAFGINVTF